MRRILKEDDEKKKTHTYKFTLCFCLCTCAVMAGSIFASPGDMAYADADPAAAVAIASAARWAREIEPLRAAAASLTCAATPATNGCRNRATTGIAAPGAREMG